MRKVSVETVKKSMDAGEPRWLSRKVRQVCEGVFDGRLGKKRGTLRSDDDEGMGPAGPNVGKADLERAVDLAEARSWRCSAEAGQLPAEGKVLVRKLDTRAESRADAGKQVEEQGEHGQAAHSAIARSSYSRIPHRLRWKNKPPEEHLAKD